jgi:hypothetical protein
MATTVAAIRSTMVTTVQALTPTSLANRPFRAHREDVEFRDWAEANPAAAFRVFSIRDTFEHEGPFVSTTVLEELRTVLACEIAYPRVGDYVNDSGARRPLVDRDDILREDIKRVRNAIGLNGYQTLDPAGGNATVFRETISMDVGEAVVFAVIRLHTMYREAMS